LGREADQSGWGCKRARFEIREHRHEHVEQFQDRLRQRRRRPPRPLGRHRRTDPLTGDRNAAGQGGGSGVGQQLSFPFIINGITTHIFLRCKTFFLILVHDSVNATKAEAKRADVTYEELAKRLERHGIKENGASIANKLARGTFAATFFLACLPALEIRASFTFGEDVWPSFIRRQQGFLTSIANTTFVGIPMKAERSC
jgi:hypothetical protein